MSEDKIKRVKICLNFEKGVVNYNIFKVYFIKGKKNNILVFYVLKNVMSILFCWIGLL